MIIYTTGSGFVAQLVRALPCHGRGREFESRRIRHIYSFRAVFCCMKRGCFLYAGGIGFQIKDWSSDYRINFVFYDYFQKLDYRLYLGNICVQSHFE